VWSVEPTVVRLAARLGVDLARRHAPDLVALAERLTDVEPVEDAIAVARRATALTNRILSYLEPVAGRS